MSVPRERSRDERLVTAAAAVSLVVGSILLVVPPTAGRALGVNSAQRTLRMIGVVDLALAPGLYLGRPRWPWLVARAASNPIIATVAMADARSVRARVIAGGLIGATIIDLRTVARMRSATPAFRLGEPVGVADRDGNSSSLARSADRSMREGQQQSR
jgi:hypothetical protein